MEQIRKLPIGIQTFDKLREGGFLYVDKTAMIYQIASTSTPYFLSRPRRFGKSLLISTFEAYFQGRKDLFQGLAIEQLETKWEQYPVLHLDLNARKYETAADLTAMLNQYLEKWELLYGQEKEDRSPEERFAYVIERACTLTGKQVVVLIDEYDKPLLQAVLDENLLDEYRKILKAFYGVLKSADRYLRFVFLTGVTKFAQVSVFSDLNQLNDISMDRAYNALCGITQDELIKTFGPEIQRLSENEELTLEETIFRLAKKYDGYHFTWPSPDVFNPFSLLNAFEDGKLNSYWFGSGTPTYLIEMLRKFHVLPSEVGHSMQAMAASFDAPTERMTTITPLLYQSGYVTIKDYDKYTELYTLDIPNREIRVGLMQSLLPNYLAYNTDMGLTTIGRMYGAIRLGDMDGALRLLQEFLSTVPYCDNTNYEGHYQQLFYIIFSLFGMYVDVEVRTPKGRVDVVMRTADTLYVIELKLGKDADAAMSQINLKNYPERFTLSGLPVVKVGISFDAEEHTLGDWLIEK